MATKRRSPTHKTVTGRVVYDRPKHIFTERDVRRVTLAWANLDTDPVGGVLRILYLLFAIAEEAWRNYPDKRIVGYWGQFLGVCIAEVMSMYQRYALEPLLELWEVIRSFLGTPPESGGQV